MATNEEVWAQGIIDLMSDDAGKDVTIKCEDQVWKVHKSTIAPRLVWFRTALANSQEVMIEGPPDGLSAATVGHVISWAYTLDFTDPVFADKDLVLMEYIKVYDAALFFDSEPLVDSVFTGIHKALVKMLDHAAKQFAPGQPDYGNYEKMQIEFKSFFQGAKLVYDFYDSLYEIFVDAVSDHKWILFRNENFRSMARIQIPRYFHDLAVAFAEVGNDPSWSGDMGVLKCHRCLHPFEDQQSAEASVYRTLHLTGKAFFMCEACHAADPEYEPGSLKPVKFKVCKAIGE
ncbi:hypothetical protein F4818DRAFT_437954 [Hypoxylon cercidicola]|nr:hypothetical protein F4818DRAFT_437954 [Hypoxylon cercidicola]